MPTRKSESGARRTDLSTARFVLATPEEPAAESSATIIEQPAASHAYPSSSSTTTTTDQQQQQQPEPSAAAADTSVLGGGAHSGSSPSEKRDKEKERERDAPVTIEDLTLPKSIITRLAKGVLPPNTQIQANAILALSKSATVFISHLANAANEFTVSSNKKTIMPADVFKALDDTEFGFMRERLEAEFAKFNEIQTSKRSTYRKKVAAAKKGGANTSMISTASGGGAEDEQDRSLLQQAAASTEGSPNQPRVTKKAKIDASAATAAADSSKMDVDGTEENGNEPSDAETVPDEQDEEDEEEEEEEEDEIEEEDEEQDEEGDGDEPEERAGPDEEDEALDDDDDSE
ncbi:hypothetical protein B0H66DRAFT_597735 [Apodospora peruviana]|uniref:DNA polymerase epsilon subunit D n=1 Tax=Apodospora peruviana TaxID=516989 RepID=A0AAE0IS36_9PEZI|nr:hypothetical protein B0H66DRAFT_597735 [Apodospora peruviana]